jgi:hypothetical protein
VWENQHLILLRASAEWLRHGTFAGQTTGSSSRRLAELPRARHVTVVLG